MVIGAKILAFLEFILLLNRWIDTVYLNVFTEGYDVTQCNLFVFPDVSLKTFVSRWCLEVKVAYVLTIMFL